MKKFNMPESETRKFILFNEDLRLMEVIGEGIHTFPIDFIEGRRYCTQNNKWIFASVT